MKVGEYKSYRFNLMSGDNDYYKRRWNELFDNINSGKEILIYSEVTDFDRIIVKTRIEKV